MEIKKLTIELLHEVMQLENQVFESEAWSERNMTAELSTQHSHYFGLFDQELIGYAGLRLSPQDHAADIQTIAVGKEHRGKGLGRTLMNRLIEVARANGSEKIFLEVKQSNSAADCVTVCGVC